MSKPDKGRAGRAWSAIRTRWDYLLLLPLALPYVSNGLRLGAPTLFDQARELREALSLVSGELIPQGMPAMGASFGNLPPLHIYILAVPIALGVDSRAFVMFASLLPFVGLVATYALSRRLAGRAVGALVLVWYLAYPQNALTGQHESLLMASVALATLALDSFERRGHPLALVAAWFLATATFSFQAFGAAPLLALLLVRGLSGRALPWRYLPWVALAALLPMAPVVWTRFELRYYELVPLFLAVVALSCRGRRGFRGIEGVGFALAVGVGVGAALAMHLTHPVEPRHIAAFGTLHLPPPSVFGEVGGSYGDAGGRWAGWLFLGALPLVVLGVVAVWRRPDKADRHLLLALLAALLVCAPIFVATAQGRHALQLVPAFLAFAAAGLASFARAWRSGRWGLRALAAAAVVCFALPLGPAARYYSHHAALLANPELLIRPNRMIYTIQMYEALVRATGLPIASIERAAHGVVEGWGAPSRLSNSSELVLALEAEAWRHVDPPERQFYFAPAPIERAAASDGGDSDIAIAPLPPTFLVPFTPTTGPWRFEPPACVAIEAPNPIDALYPPFINRDSWLWGGAIAELLPSLPETCRGEAVTGTTRRRASSEVDLDLLVVVLSPLRPTHQLASFELLVDGVPRAPVRVDELEIHEHLSIDSPTRLVYDLADVAAEVELSVRFPTDQWAAVDVHDAHRGYLEVLGRTEAQRAPASGGEGAR